MADAKTPTRLHLVIVTRERKVVDAEVDEVFLPGAEGALGILPGHTPLLAALRPGELVYRDGASSTSMAVGSGLAEVLPDRVIVLAGTAYLSEEIEVEAAERDRTAAEKELASLAFHDEEFALAQAKLEESVAKIQVKTRRS